MSPELWEHVRESLVFYFSRRHARSDAEDLAQETLLAVWNREDYVFEKETDFVKVCYGFARNVSREAYRRDKITPSSPLDPSLPAPKGDSSGPEAIEARIMVDQVCEIGRSKLERQDWQMVQRAANSNRSGPKPKSNGGMATRVRVKLHRVRKKLAQLSGLDKNRGVTPDAQ